MGDHADDIIDAGMMEERPFGFRENRAIRLSQHQQGPRVKPPEKRSEPSVNDQFTWWYDEIMSENAQKFPSAPISHFDIAAMAWHEAWKRATKK